MTLAKIDLSRLILNEDGKPRESSLASLVKDAIRGLQKTDRKEAVSLNGLLEAGYTLQYLAIKIIPEISHSITFAFKPPINNPNHPLNKLAECTAFVPGVDEFYCYPPPMNIKLEGEGAFKPYSDEIEGILREFYKGRGQIRSFLALLPKTDLNELVFNPKSFTFITRLDDGRSSDFLSVLSADNISAPADKECFDKLADVLRRWFERRSSTNQMRALPYPY